MVKAEELIREIEKETTAEDLIGIGRKPIKGKFRIKRKRFRLKPITKTKSRFKLRPNLKTQRKLKSIVSRTGRGLVQIGKRVAPIIKKQARLIRDQQLRDDALARRLSKGKPVKKKKVSKQKSQGLDLFNDLGF